MSYITREELTEVAHKTLLDNGVQVDYERTREAVWELFYHLTHELSKGRPLQLRRFFSLRIKNVPEYRRNTYDGSGGHRVQTIPAHKRIIFRPSDTLRRSLEQC